MKYLSLALSLLISVTQAAAQSVGIGTNAPKYELHIHRDNTSQAGLNITHSGLGDLSGRGLLLRMVAGSARLINQEIDGDIVLSTRSWSDPIGVPRIFIRGDGRVGINTSDPNAQFTVRGNFGNSPLSVIANESQSVDAVGLRAVVGGTGASAPAVILGSKAVEGVAYHAGFGVYGYAGNNGVGVMGYARTGGRAGYFLMNDDGGVVLYAESRSDLSRVADFQCNGCKAPVSFNNTVPQAAGSFPFAFEVTGTGSNFIFIPNTGHANAASDLLFVQHKWTNLPVSDFHVRWAGTNWIIATNNGSAIPAGEVFNVMVVKR